MRFLKEYVIILVILIIIGVIEIVTNKTLNHVVDWMNDEISSIENKIKEKKEEDAEQEFYDFEEEWNKKENRLSLFLEHNELEKVSKDIVLIDANFKSDEAEKALENIAELKFTVKHIHEKNKLKLKNLF